MGSLVYWEEILYFFNKANIVFNITSKVEKLTNFIMYQG